MRRWQTRTELEHQSPTSRRRAPGGRRCRDSTAPNAPLTIRIVAPAVMTGHAALFIGEPGYECLFPLAVSAMDGARGDYATWTGGTVNFRLSSNGQTLSSAWSQGDFASLFGTLRVRFGESVNGTLAFGWSGPFTASFVANYSVYSKDGVRLNDRSITTPLTCQ